MFGTCVLQRIHRSQLRHLVLSEICVYMAFIHSDKDLPLHGKPLQLHSKGLGVSAGLLAHQLHSKAYLEKHPGGSIVPYHLQPWPVHQSDKRLQWTRNAIGMCSNINTGQYKIGPHPWLFEGTPFWAVISSRHASWQLRVMLYSPVLIFRHGVHRGPELNLWRKIFVVDSS